jgi:hypothetical protein
MFPVWLDQTLHWLQVFQNHPRWYEKLVSCLYWRCRERKIDASSNPDENNDFLIVLYENCRYSQSTSVSFVLW